MLYLSRLIIDTSSGPVRRDLADCYALHRTILKAFPQAPAGTEARAHFGLLYRAEPIAHAPQLMRLLVQSNQLPDWNQLPARYLGPAPDERGNPALRAIDDEYQQIADSSQLVFRLRANPTKKLSDRSPGRENKLLGKRVALLREEEQLAWLVRKGESHGFCLITTTARPEVAQVRAAPQEQARGRRAARDGNAAMPLHFGAVLFEGQLQVTSRERFLQTLATGIGSGKAFGFGLLSIASAR